MALAGSAHLTDIEMSVQGAEYLDPSTPALDLPRSLSQRSPSHYLWFGVLELAVREIMTSEHAKLVRDSLEWVIQPTREQGAFLWITDNLQMPSEDLQHRLVEIGAARLRILTAQRSASSRAKRPSS